MAKLGHVMGLVAAVALGHAASPALANCASDLTVARSMASSLVVTVEAPQPVRFDQPIKIKWQITAKGQPQSPLYLAVTAPADVRFGGTGFVALAAGAAGPWKLGKGADGARAFVPLHRKDAAKSGEIIVRPYRAGPQAIEWAIVTAGACGEHAFAADKRFIDVGAGAPRIVVQDHFTTVVPNASLRSSTGAHELRVFDDRYEVHDAVNGGLLFGRPGTGPGFSPTGRYMFAERPRENRAEVIDLLSLRVFDVSRGSIGWAMADSFIAVGKQDTGEISVINILKDGPVLLFAHVSCMVCSAPDTVRVRLDIDNGYLAAIGNLEWRVVDLASRRVFPADGAKRDELYVQGRRGEWYAEAVKLALSARDPLASARPFIQRSFDPRARDAPAGWATADGTPFVVTADRKDRPAPVADSDRGRAAGEGEAALTTTRSARGHISADDPADGQPAAVKAAHQSIFSRLAAVGIATEQPAELAHPHLVDLGGVEMAALDEAQRKGEALAAEIIRQMPNARALFRSGSQCYFGNAPQNRLFVDPRNIAQAWHWRGGGTDRWLIQTICYRGAAGRHVTSDLVAVSKTAITDLTPLLGQDATDTWEIGDEPIRIRAFRGNADLLALSSPLTERAVIVDTRTWKQVGAAVSVVDSTLLGELRVTADQGHVVQLNTDGRFFVHRIADRKRVLVGAHVDDEIVVASDEGLYDTTYEGAQTVQVRFPGMGGLHRFSQFEKVLYRPGLAAAVLSGRGLTAPSALVSAPPSVAFTLTEKDGQRVGRATARAAAQLVELRLYLDGRLIRTVPLSGAQAETELALADTGGGHWLTAVAIDAGGLASQPAAVRLAGPVRARGTLRAVTIGIDAYRDPALPRLGFAKTDARMLERALKANAGQAFNRIEVADALLDDAATPASILGAVRDAAGATGPDDTLVISYAGHGIDGGSLGQPDSGLALTTTGTRLGNLAETALSWRALADALSQARGTVVVLLDACHAGIAGREAFATNDDAVSALFTRSGAPMVVLAASKGRQLSRESEQAGGGLFTSAIVAAIVDERTTADRDRSGLIDLSELYASIKARVVKASDGRQTPWLARNGLVGEMALF